MTTTLLKEFANSVYDILRPFDQLDVLLYYAIISEKLIGFLRNKEIATKIWLPHNNIRFFLRRATAFRPLYIQDFSHVSLEMIEMRAKYNIGKVRNKLTEKQILLWDYFVPRKLVDFFYACNGEKRSKTIDRIFIDIDRGKKVDTETAREVTCKLVEIIENDLELQKLIKYKVFVMWTGNSFHVYLILKNQIEASFYNKYLTNYRHQSGNSFIERWVKEIRKNTGINVKVGHEKLKDYIIVDPSGTPIGKLARTPFSLHMKSATEIDGVALPLVKDELRNKQLIKKLRSYTPQRVVKELDSLSLHLTQKNDRI